MGFRVYIAKITFTTLIDHFTSLYALQALVYSYQLIKLELLTQSIRQQKLPPHLRFLGIRPGCPSGLSCKIQRSLSCFGYRHIQLRRLILTGFHFRVNTIFKKGQCCDGKLKSFVLMNAEATVNACIWWLLWLKYDWIANVRRGRFIACVRMGRKTRSLLWNTMRFLLRRIEW